MTSSTNPKITDLTARLALHPKVPLVLAGLNAGPEIAHALAQAMPGIPKDQQRALLTVVWFRLTGAHLPASVTLLERLPLLRGLHGESIGAAFQLLVEGGVLEVQAGNPEAVDVLDKAMCFVWPALERLLVAVHEPRPAAAPPEAAAEPAEDAAPAP